MARQSRRAASPPNGSPEEPAPEADERTRAGAADEPDIPNTTADADAATASLAVPSPPEPLDLAEASGRLRLPPLPAERTRVLEGAPDPGLYGLLGLTPDVTDAEIQTAYRRQAARLMDDGGSGRRTMRQLNAAYEVLGNPVRRAEYDHARRLALHTAYATQPSAALEGHRAASARTRRSRPRQMVQTRTAGLPEVLVVVGVVALSIVVGSIIIERVAVNLSGLNVLSSILSLTTGPRRLTIDSSTPDEAAAPAASSAAASATAVPTRPSAEPTATVPAATDRFAGSTVGVSSQNPPQYTSESILVRLRRDGQPAADVEVYANVQYRTTLERWPNQGTVRTDSNGAATITFNVGPATPGYPVQVQVFALADGQQVSWSTSFTPR